jgi:hypothetical protein
MLRNAKICCAKQNMGGERERWPLFRAIAANHFRFFGEVTIAFYGMDAFGLKLSIYTNFQVCLLFVAHCGEFNG